MGHNEFIEAGFAAEIAKQWKQPWMLRLTEKLANLRAMNLGVSVVEDLIADGVAPPPETWQKRSEIFAGMTWDKTQLFYDVYRENMEAMYELARDSGALLVCATILGNDFDPPMVSTPPPGTTEETTRRCARLRQEAVALIPARFRTGVLPTGADNPVIRLRPSIDWESATRGGPTQRPAGFVQPEVPAMRPHEGDLAAAPFWSDPSGWPLPPVFTLVATSAAIYERRLDEAERASLREACTRYEEVLRLCPDILIALYELGLCTWLLGEDDARAAELLRRSVHFDRAPTRGNDIINGILRDLAAERADDPGVRFVDIEAWFRERSPSGLVGYEVMMDNCHLHEASRAILVEQFVAPLVELSRDVLAER